MGIMGTDYSIPEFIDGIWGLSSLSPIIYPAGSTTAAMDPIERASRQSGP
jgi:hypothetical protein